MELILKIQYSSVLKEREQADKDTMTSTLMVYYLQNFLF